jgi:hypothetical protein
MPVVVSVLEHHLSTGTSDNVLIYGVVRTLEDMIVSVILRNFPERLNFVSYWGATKADIGGQGQCVRPNSPTVILVTAAAATGINLEDVGTVLAFKVQDVCELQQIAGRANRDASRDRVPIVVCVDEATLRLPTVTTAFRRTLAALRRTHACVVQQILAEMVPPTVSAPVRCGGCAVCDKVYGAQVIEWNTASEEEGSAEVLPPAVSDDVPSQLVQRVMADSDDSSDDENDSDQMYNSGRSSSSTM